MPHKRQTQSMKKQNLAQYTLLILLIPYFVILYFIINCIEKVFKSQKNKIIKNWPFDQDLFKFWGPQEMYLLFWFIILRTCMRKVSGTHFKVLFNVCPNT